MLSKLAQNSVYNFTLFNLLFAAPFIIMFLSCWKKPPAIRRAIGLRLLMWMTLVLSVVNGVIILLQSILKDMASLAEQTRRAVPYSAWRFLPVGIMISGLALLFMALHAAFSRGGLSAKGKLFLVILSILPIVFAVLCLVLLPQVSWILPVQLCIKTSFIGWLITAFKLSADTTPSGIRSLKPGT